MLDNNGGYRPEFHVRDSGDMVFKRSLRPDERTGLKHFADPVRDRADITTYMNWKSSYGKIKDS